MKKLITIVALFVAVSAHAQLKPLPARLDTEALMKTKLASAQKVLGGIATEDFKTIQREATKLHEYSRAQAWMADRSPEYNQLTKDFRRQANALVKAAREKNVDGATVAYFQMTVSCVNCHKLMRSTK